MDGYHATDLREESLALAEVDLVTTHHYPGGRKSFAELIRANWAKAQGRKPYVVGEFGFVDTAQMAAAIEAVLETGTAGALAWSLRFRNRDGGFYWHSEPAGGDKYKAFHWPGFATGADYDEAGLLTLLQRRAYDLRGLPVPKLVHPPPPRLLPIRDAAAITWQGSVGATGYRVERATRRAGPWATVAEGVDETAVQYRPLFADETAPRGRWFYRVRARNAAGHSAPSNVVGPVHVNQVTLVDELADFTRLRERHGTLEVKSHECRKAQEDIHRLAGRPGSALIYQTAGPIRRVRVYAFSPGEVADFRFARSSDGRAYAPVAGHGEVLFTGAGDYGYWKPARYECVFPAGQERWLRIEYGAEAQIARIEIDHGFAP
jgi:hypothetical protein